MRTTKAPFASSKLSEVVGMFKGRAVRSDQDIEAALIKDARNTSKKPKKARTPSF